MKITIILPVLFYLLLISYPTEARVSIMINLIDITITGDWFLVIDESDLQAGAGSDLNDTYLSATDQIRVDILNTNSELDCVYPRVCKQLAS